MINRNELIRKIEDLQYNAKFKVQASIGLNVGLNLGVLFGSLIGGVVLFPISIFGVGIIIGSSINYFRVSSKLKKLFENIIDLEKYKDQMEFLNKLSKLIDEHYKEAFKGYNFIKEEQICKQIKLNSPQQMDSKLIGELKLQTQKIFQTQEDNHYNILVLGKTGVGKSTLINVVLDLKGEKAAKENAIMPETGVDNNEIIFNNLEKTKKKFIPIEYGSEKSSLVLLDSRGIETSKRYNIDIAAEDITQFIKERNSFDADPDKFIHCIWYLVSGKRFEDDEGNYVKSLKSLYTNFGLPIIFVYTQAINEEDGDLIEERIGEFMGENINFIQIIARDIFIKTKRKTTKLEAFGVFDEDGLIKKTFDLSRNAIKSSYFNYMKNLLKNIFVNNIKMQSYLKTNLLICTKIKSVIHEKNKSLEEIRNSFENEFLDIINNFLIDKENPR